MIYTRNVALAGILTLAAQAAQAGNESRFEAFAVPGGLFEVVADFSENAIYWCGAAVYSQSQLSKSATQRIYVWKGPSPSVAKPDDVSVQFGFTPPPGAGAGNTYTNDVSVVGNSLSLIQAQQGCTERSASG